MLLQYQFLLQTATSPLLTSSHRPTQNVHKTSKALTHAYNQIVKTQILSFATSLSVNAQLLIKTVIRKRSTPWLKLFYRLKSSSQSWMKLLILVWTQLILSFLRSGTLLLTDCSSGLLALALFRITISKL